MTTNPENPQTVQELVQNGHTVLGLVRTDAQAEAITKLGAEPHMGSLKDLERLKSGAKVVDGVILWPSFTISTIWPLPARLIERLLRLWVRFLLVPGTLSLLLSAR